jgi:hypothetical protein
MSLSSTTSNFNIHILKKDTIIYRGLNNVNNDILTDIVTWFALDENDAKLYGSLIYEYKLTADIILIDVLDTNFHNDYMAKLNNLFKGNNHTGFDVNKFNACIPLGLPNYTVQRRFLNHIDISKNKLTEKQKVCIECMNGKHRYSEFSRDKYMVSILKYLYNHKYHGYMTDIMWPSIYHNGYFNREICIFEPMKCLMLYKITKNNGGSSMTKSTKRKKPEYIKVPKGDSWNRMNDPRLTPEMWKETEKEILDSIDSKTFEMMGLDIHKNKG